MDFPRKVYAIQHNLTKRIYIGSTKNVDLRYASHINALRAGKHTVEDMQKDFNEYGENYSLFVLDEITEFADKGKEYELMRKYNTFTRGIGYNYKDHARATQFQRNAVPYKKGFPAPFSEAIKEDVVADYLDKIDSLLNECSDVPLLDLILKLLEKHDDGE